MKYDDGKHLHLGYHEEGHDIEGIALKVDGKEEWHVFFNFGEYGLRVPVGLKHRHAREETYAGVHVFTVTDKQANNREIHNKFSSFVVKKVIPSLERQERMVQS